MPHVPKELTSDERVRNLEDQVRRLWTKMPMDTAWPWFSLRPYLCGGWIDPFSSHPNRNVDGVLDPATVADKAGFFDTGQLLFFTGNIAWDPGGWFSVSPWTPEQLADPLQQGDPPRYMDSKTIIANRDGLNRSSSATDSDNSLGCTLPYVGTEQGSGIYTLPLSAHWHYALANSWLDGAVLSFTPLQDLSGFHNGMNWSFHSLVGFGNEGKVTDPAGFVHETMPGNLRAAVSLNGLIIRYSKRLPVPTSLPGHPRDCDNFFGVDMSDNLTGLVGL